MKLTQELKDRIDTYFDNVSVDDLYKKVVVKYGFTELTMEIENKSFSTTKTTHYVSNESSIFNNKKSKSSHDLSLAA